MINLVAGYARGYGREEIRPFLRSLRETGYQGRILLFADGGAAEEAKRWDVDLRPMCKPTMKVHSARFISLQEALLNTTHEGVFLSDTRDVIFQTDPTYRLPFDGINAFEEDLSQTIGSCPYNSDWIKIGYGEGVLKELSGFPISCVGTSCGDRDSMKSYLKALRNQVERLQPMTSKPQDQGAHNYLVRKVLNAWIWGNEEGEVYTVGYIPRGTVPVVDGQILNREGRVPAVVHQWDRHVNLKQLVEEKFL